MKDVDFSNADLRNVKVSKAYLENVTSPAQICEELT